MKNRNVMGAVRCVCAAAACAAFVCLGVAYSESEVDSAAVVDQLAKKISAIHKLPLKQPVKHMVVSRKKLLSRIKEIVFTDYTQEEIIDEGRMMVRLGLFPQAVDYQKTIFMLLEEQVIGLYDTIKGELLLVDYLPDLMKDTTVAHEITHAVQDQHFDLKNLLKRRKAEGDLKYAVSAVFEGDALIMEENLSGAAVPDYLDAEGIENMMLLMTEKQSKLFKVPQAMRRALLFPYSYGYVFMKKAYGKGGYDEVNAIMADPPESTEQILHPEAYFANDVPDSVTFKIPSEVLSLYRVAAEDVMGEFFIRIWLQEHIEGLEAYGAAAGWEGDWFFFLWPSSAKVGKGHIGRGVFMLVSKWEAAGEGGDCDAGEFFQTLDKAVNLRWKPIKQTAQQHLKIYKNYYKEWIVLQRSADTVIYIEGLPSSLFPDPEEILRKIETTVQ